MIVIKGAGDIASGVAVRLFRCGMPFVMTDLARPTAIRRTVSFCQAIVDGETTVEGIRARFASDLDAARAILCAGEIPVLADPGAACVKALYPVAVVDAILAKRNFNTSLSDAPIVVALGPGFTALADCHAVIETMRGHTLGTVILEGSAIPNTGSPGDIGGYTDERILRAPCNGIFTQLVEIGATVQAGETVGLVGAGEMRSEIDGVLRGILPSGTNVRAGMKSGDVDPRCEKSHCYSVSDKARAIAGGVLEALLYLANQRGLRENLWQTM